jgi:hypothetical protein
MGCAAHLSHSRPPGRCPPDAGGFCYLARCRRDFYLRVRPIVCAAVRMGVAVGSAADMHSAAQPPVAQGLPSPPLSASPGLQAAPSALACDLLLNSKALAVGASATMWRMSLLPQVGGSGMQRAMPSEQVQTAVLNWQSMRIASTAVLHSVFWLALSGHLATTPVCRSVADLLLFAGRGLDTEGQRSRLQLRLNAPTAGRFSCAIPT